MDLITSPSLDTLRNQPVITNTTIDKWTAVSRDYLTEAGYPLAFLSSVWLPYLLYSLSQQKRSPDTKSAFDSEYDFIIVGAGSAGSTLASRLSEYTCIKVLLLEAGKPPPLMTEVPVITAAFYKSDIDWNYYTVPQKNTGSGLVGNRFQFTSGKTLGGSSTINAMLAVRGNRWDFDNWAAHGAVGWSYEEILPYFMRLENNTEQKYLQNGYHATGGPIWMEIPRYESKLKKHVMDAAKELGYKFVDSNAETQTGFFENEATMRIGQRCSTAKGYLVPADNRENLDIVPNAMVRKVLFNGTKAIGVEFDFNGTRHQVMATKEVILSAGAIGSPQLLMLSGIGHKEELAKFNIPLVADLPVGNNLQDHVASPVFFDFDPTKMESALVTLINPVNQLEYIENRTNKFAGTFGGPLLAFLNNDGNNVEEDLPDYELYFLEGPSFGIARTFNMNPHFYSKVFGPVPEKPFLMCTSQQLRPRSTGTVRLNSSDPYDHPLIDPEYYKDLEDMEDVIHGMKTCRKLANTAAMKELGCKEFTTVYPGCEREALFGDEDGYLRCMVKVFSMSIWHKSGTAKMGAENDPTTVVDPELRVKNVQNLRVVDASIMPFVTSGNTNLPVIMIAEKAADMIKATMSCENVTEGNYGVRQPATS